MIRYKELDALRGVAALIVLIGHYLMLFPAYESYRYEPNSPFIVYLVKETPFRIVFSSGNESVILFFVLSGFVLYLSITNTRFTYSAYLIKRICRIYLPYLVAILIAIVAKMLLSHADMPFVSNWFSKSWSAPETPALFVQHLLFIGQYDTDAYNNVIWSLVHEMRVSIIFPFLILLFIRTKFKYSLICLIVLIFSSTFGLYLLGSGVKLTSIFLTFHYITIFLLGALLAKYRHVLVTYVVPMKKSLKIILLAIATSCFLYEGIIGEIDFLNNYIFRNYVVSFGVCILLIISVSLQTFRSLLQHSILTFLGQISYSLYLYHLISLFSFMYLFYDTLPIALILILSFLCTLLLSSLSYRFVEKPCISLGQYLTKREKNVDLAAIPANHTVKNR